MLLLTDILYYSYYYNSTLFIWIVLWVQCSNDDKGHWLQKTAEHVYGSVLCSPGCFSLVRCAAIYRKSGEPMDLSVETAIETYSHEVASAMDVLKFDQGKSVSKQLKF